MLQRTTYSQSWQPDLHYGCRTIVRMLQRGWLCRVLLTGVIAAGTFARAGVPPPGLHLGVLNSLTGDVSIDGVAAGPVGAGRTVLGIGHAIKTGEGMAELLLTPGSVLRVGNHSELNLEAGGTSEIRVRLQNGESLLEVLALQIPIVLEQNGVTVTVQEPGLYDFDEKHGVTVIYRGAAQVRRNSKQIVAREGFAVKARSLRAFPSNPDPGSKLFSWSNLRSGQLSRDSAVAAQTIQRGAGTWRGPAWYWNPWSASYTFLSASGSVTGPFGWSYYSPGYAPNDIPAHRPGDSYLYGQPILPGLGPTLPVEKGSRGTVPAVPLTAPGVPQFPNSRFNPR
jgi:hypothetical protein